MLNISLRALWVRHLPALAFVPEERVIESFEHLIESECFERNETILATLVDYFENTWVGKLTRANRRRRPKFAISIWYR